MSERERILRQRIRALTIFFIFALVLSGATAIPLETELNILASLFGNSSSALSEWIHRVRDGLRNTNANYPFMAYGTDWLAFGHFAIAVAFIGPLRDPVRNVWVYEFGMIASVLIIPFSFLVGPFRGIPFYWGLIDCSFGVFGFIPLWLCRKYALELEKRTTNGHE